ncbi:MAG: aminoglycoside phosphotransferase family protein [Chthonomonadaceae bacterium]|nr:aminoglycoside phosphotransferase family protein [Chthonomonadaceae bacterium]
MPYSPDLIRTLARRHGIEGEPALLPSGGMVNEAWLVGDAHVLRIAVAEGCDDEAAREEAVMPLVLEAGICAPRLVGCDLKVEHAPRPYTIWERASGVLLGYCKDDPRSYQPAFTEIGRQIARLGRILPPPDVLPHLRRCKRGDPRQSLRRAVARDRIGSRDADEIGRWIEAVQPQLGRCRRRVLLHQDIHPWNVFVDPETRQLTALIDWGDAAIGDPAFEFASMPVFALPAMLEGYRAEGGAPDKGFVARALWNGLSLALWEIRELDPELYDPRWWRFGPDGWPKLREAMAELFGIGV